MMSPKRISLILSAVAALSLCSWTCTKSLPGSYHDSDGNEVNLLGGWVLSSIQIKSAGVVETIPMTPSSIMEFQEKGLGRTLSMDGDVIGTFHYETYRGSVTMYTEEEWENNRSLSEDDDAFQRGKNYPFKVKDSDTISYETISDGITTMTSVFTRYDSYRVNLPGRSDPLGYSPTTLIITYDGEEGKESLLAAISKSGAEIIYDYSIIPAVAIRIPKDWTLGQAEEYFRRVKGVASVEKDRISHIQDPLPDVVL